MKLISLGLLTALSIAPAGCAEEPEQGPTCGDLCDGEDENLINGISATEFYDLLTYEVDEASFAPFRYLSADTGTTLENGLKGQLDLYLLPSGVSYAEYGEWRRTGGGSSELVGEESIIQGSWSIDGTTLIVDGLGSAEGLSFNGANAVSLTPAADLGNAGLAGSPMILVSTRSTGGLFHILGTQDDGTCDTDFGEFCSYTDDCGACECGDGICQDQFSWLEDAASCAIDCAQ